MRRSARRWTVWSRLERKGYFAFARGGMRIVDNIVTSFSEEDVRPLGDNVVLILQTVKEMTQPEIMNFVRNTVQVIEREKDQPVDTSLRRAAAPDARPERPPRPGADAARAARDRRAGSGAAATASNGRKSRRLQ